MFQYWINRITMIRSDNSNLQDWISVPDYFGIMNKYKQRFCYGAPCSPHHLSSLTLTQHAEALLKSGDFSEARSPCWSPTGSRRLTKQRLQVGPHRRRISTRTRQTLRSVLNGGRAGHKLAGAHACGLADPAVSPRVRPWERAQSSELRPAG